MRAGDNVKFNQSKHFKFIRELGSGGTGVTNLFKDETTDTFFAIKKYQPSGGNIEYEQEYYNRFVDEIKILFQLSHPNIVRVYNYYLYPQNTLGYLQMEYIEGVSIDEYVENNFVDLNNLFRSAIDAFVCLEKNSILHRDIRPANIMVDNSGQIKVIDFGFGKILDNDNSENSILLNWPATEHPNEIKYSNDYTVQTEIYYLGYLFKKLIRENNIEDFKFLSVLDKMCEGDKINRYKSFNDVSADIAKGFLLNLSFTNAEKKTYLAFAKTLVSLIDCFYESYSPIMDENEVLTRLEDILKISILEDYVQDEAMLLSSFVTNEVSRSIHSKVSVFEVKSFYELLLNSNKQKKKIILENLRTRLSTIRVLKDPFDDLPF